ncbi:hypothetical protein BH24ACT9_BH24ACT9_01950 [soil metagenome]
MHSRTARTGTVQVQGGVGLRVLRWDGRMPGFVLVHGLASNALLWHGVSEALSGSASGDVGGHAVTAIDLRGHGASDVPESGYDTVTAASDVAAVIATLGLDRPVVAGQSWGGNVVMELAADHPDLVAAIALVDGGWIQLQDTFASWDKVLQTLSPPDMSERSWSTMPAMIRAAHPDWADWAIEATMANLRELPDGGVHARLSREHHLSILRSMWDHSVTDRYADVRVPSLLVPAGSRTGPKAAAVECAAAALAGSEVRWYEGADHDVHAQHPGRLAADLIVLAERATLRANVGDL